MENGQKITVDPEDPPITTTKENCANCDGDFVETRSNCENGQVTVDQTYTITTPAVNGGAACSYMENGQKITVDPEDPPITTTKENCANCDGDFVETRSNCENGQVTVDQTYTITTPAVNGGAACSYMENGQKITVDPEDPPITTTKENCANCDGVWEDAYSTECIDGQITKYKRYKVITPLSNGGLDCPVPDGKIQTISMTTVSCPTNCSYDIDWDTLQSTSTGKVTVNAIVSKESTGSGKSCTDTDLYVPENGPISQGVTTTKATYDFYPAEYTDCGATTSPVIGVEVTSSNCGDGKPYITKNEMPRWWRKV